MIKQNSSSIDYEDVAVLFAAIAELNLTDTATVELERSLAVIGYAEVLFRCERAALFIADLAPKSAEWDSAAWFKLLATSGPSSLAYALFVMDREDDDADYWGEQILDIVIAWFKRCMGVEVSPV